MTKFEHIKYLQDIRHSLVLINGTITTDRPDEFGLDTDGKKNLCWAVDMDNEIAMLDEMFAVLTHTHRAGTMVGKDIDTCADCGHDLRHDIHKSPA